MPPFRATRVSVAHALKLLTATIAILTSGCGSDSATPAGPTATPPSAPPAVTIALTGTVSSAAGTPISNGQIRILDGPNSGRTATSSTSGTYRFDQLVAGNANLAATAPGFQENRQGIGLTGTHTLNFTLQPMPVATGPRTSFGAGQYRVGTDIAPGRYYTDPVDGCYWERQSGFGGTTGEIIANEFVSFNALQWIVDILPSDRGFQTDSECRTWSVSPPHGPQPNIIPPGVWRVGDQVAAGTYQSNVRDGCYWERVRNFENRIASIIANDFIAAGGQRTVTISSSDVGFHNDADCGTWTRTQSLSPSSIGDRQTSREVEHNWRRHRALVEGRR
jgi:hypothetical protein